jgi:hypothetical protein
MPRQIVLDWSRLYRWQEPEGLPEEVALEIGIYQISRIFGGGDEGLIYVGIVWSDQRNFRMRMQEHRKKWLSNLRGIHFRFGTIRPLRGLSQTRELVEEIEGALVFHLKPEENTSKISSYSIRYDLIIMNRGSRGPLPPRVDTSTHPWG